MNIFTEFRTGHLTWAVNKLSQYQLLGNDVKTFLVATIPRYKDADIFIKKMELKFQIAASGLETMNPLILKALEAPDGAIAADSTYSELNSLIDADLATDYDVEIQDNHFIKSDYYNGASTVKVGSFTMDLTKKARKVMNMLNRMQDPKEEFYPAIYSTRLNTDAQTTYIWFTKTVQYEVIPRKKTSINTLTPT